MRPLILTSSLLLLVLGGVAVAKDPKYLKLLENCADKLSQPAIASTQEWKIEKLVRKYY